MTETKTIDELRGEYVKQLIAAGSQDGADYLVGALLDEYGSKAYVQGWNHAFDTIQRLMGEYRR